MVGPLAHLAWLTVLPSARSVRLVPPSHLSSFRRIAIGSWRTAADPTVYGTLSLRAEAALAWVRAAGTESETLGLTALMVEAVARAFSRLPEANALLHWNQLLLRPSVDVAVLAPVRRPDEPPHLEPRLLEHLEGRSALEILRRLESGAPPAALPRQGTLARAAARIRGWVRPEPGATAWVAEVGALPFDTAYLPLPPGAKVPLVLVPGLPQQTPVVEDGVVRPGWVLPLHASFDHRLLDGWHAAQLALALRAAFEAPAQR